MSYEELTRDFETTSFNYVVWGKLHKEILDNYGDENRVLSKAIERFLKEECSISADVLERIKGIMIDEK